MSGSNAYVRVRPALLCPLAILGGRVVGGGWVVGGGVLGSWEGCCATGAGGDAGADLSPVVIIKKYLSCCALVMMRVVYTTKNNKCGLEHSFRSHYFAWLDLPAHHRRWQALL